MRYPHDTNVYARMVRCISGACVGCALLLAIGVVPAIAEEAGDEHVLTPALIGASAPEGSSDDATAMTDVASPEQCMDVYPESGAANAEADAPKMTDSSEGGEGEQASDVPAFDPEASGTEVIPEPMGEDAPASDSGATPTLVLEDVAVTTTTSDEFIQEPNCPSDAVSTEEVGASCPEATAHEDTNLKPQVTTTTAKATEATKAAVLERPANGTYVIKMDTSKKLVLTAVGKTVKAGSTIKLATYTGKNGQKWVVVYDKARKRYRLFVSGSGRKLALGVKKSKGIVDVCVLSAKKASLKSILWTFVCAKDGTYRLANAAYKGKRLDVAGKKVKKGANVIIAAKAKTGHAQSQSFDAYTTKPKVRAGKARLEGSYNVVLDANQKVCVSVKGDSAASGANVLLGNVGVSLTQRLYLQRDEKGFYSVWVIGSGKVLDVKDASVLPGTNVRQASNTQKDNQKWALVAKANGDGTYTVTLQNKATGLFLGAAKAKSGSNLAGVEASDTSKIIGFRLKPRDMLDAGIYEIKPTSSSMVSLNVTHALSDNSKKGGLQLYTDNDSLAERFELVSAEGDGLWRVRTASSGGWLTWNGGSSVVQAGKGSDEARGANTWRLSFKNGSFSLTNVSSGKALEMAAGSQKSGTKIVVAAPSGQSAQAFWFESSSLFGGRYVALQSDEGKHAKAGATDISTVALAKASSTLAQAFFLEKSGQHWKLRDYHGRYVTTTGTVAKTDIVSRADSGGSDQLWNVCIADGGKVAFTNVRSGLAIVAGTSKPQLGAASSPGAGWTLLDRTVDAMRERISQVATHFAEHDAHGYSQPNRGTGAQEVIVVQDGAKVTISSSDVDCSELVRQCVNTVLGFDAIGFMWTGNEDELLITNGFVRMLFSMSAVQRGDILWRSGHTGVALSAKKQAEALMDEYGGIYGYSRGDQTGNEVAVNSITAGAWTYIYRYVG